MKRCATVAAGVLVAAGIVFGGGAMGGCSTVPQGPIDTPETVTAQQWRAFAAELAAKMEASGVLTRYQAAGGVPAVLAIGDFKNRTESPRFTRTRQIMYNELEAALVRSGKVIVNKDVAGTGGTVDELLQRIGELQRSGEYASTSYTGGNARIPTLILYGEIVSDRITGTSGGKGATQFDYQVRVDLLDVGQKAAVWIETVNLTKLWARSGVGF